MRTAAKKSKGFLQRLRTYVLLLGEVRFQGSLCENRYVLINTNINVTVRAYQFKPLTAFSSALALRLSQSIAMTVPPIDSEPKNI